MEIQKGGNDIKMMIFLKSGKAILWQNRKPDQFCLGIFLHSKAPHNLPIPNMHFLKNRTKKRIPGSGHENGPDST